MIYMGRSWKKKKSVIWSSILINLRLRLLINGLNYRKSSIRSRTCIILDPKFPRLVLEVFQKLLFLEQIILLQPVHNGTNKIILKDLNFCQ